MKKLLLIALMAFATSATASPFVVSDAVDSRVTHCGVLIDAAAKVVIPVTLQGTAKICKHDIVGVTEGSHSIKMTAIVNDPVWGSQESAPSVPLAFVRPSIPAVPAGLGLQP